MTEGIVVIDDVVLDSTVIDGKEDASIEGDNILQSDRMSADKFSNTFTASYKAGIGTFASLNSFSKYFTNAVPSVWERLITNTPDDFR